MRTRTDLPRCTKLLNRMHPRAREDPGPALLCAGAMVFQQHIGVATDRRGVEPSGVVSVRFRSRGDLGAQELMLMLRTTQDEIGESADDASILCVALTER